MTLAIIFCYLALVLLIGGVSHRFFRGTGTDFFIASRTIGPFILLMTLFGTHMTAFSLLGASGEAYHHGIGVFALMASSSALMVPLTIYLMGPRLWQIGKKHGYLTQVQFFTARYDAAAPGLLLFVILTLLMIPYLLIGVMGGGITMHSMTGGAVPQWVGRAIVCAVIFSYVSYSGLRGTAWVNTFQTLVFMVLGAVAFYTIVKKLGGLEPALLRVAESRPELLVRGGTITPLNLWSYTFIPLSVGMFPHIFMHWLSAKSARTFRLPIIFYPLCIVVVWVPSVLLGVLGNIDFAGLQGPAANSVLVEMVAHYAPGVMGGFLAAGVMAAIMSSLDSQTLALGTMFTQDIVRRYGRNKELSETQQVRYGRVFVLGILLVTFLLSLATNRSIFKLAVWSFTGFAGLLPLGLAALYWKRSTKAGALASLLTVAGCWLYFFSRGWAHPGYTVGDTGLMPVVVIFLLGALSLVGISLVTRPPRREVVEAFFGAPAAPAPPRRAPEVGREAF